MIEFHDFFLRNYFNERAMVMAINIFLDQGSYRAINMETLYKFNNQSERYTRLWYEIMPPSATVMDDGDPVTEDKGIVFYRCPRLSE